MADYTINTLFLGNLHELDPLEGSGNIHSELRGDLVGLVIGGPADPVSGQVQQVTLHDDNNDGLVQEDDNGQQAEHLTFDNQRAALDSSDLFYARIVYSNGSIAENVPIVVAQDELGRVFVLPVYRGSQQNDDLMGKAIESIELVSASGVGFRALTADLEPDAFLCFTTGTLIRTPDGDVPIEGLNRGDFVTTLDSGPQRIVWIGSQTVAVTQRTAPVKFAAGSLGPQSPSQDLHVSQQHRMLLCSRKLNRFSGSDEVFAAAKFLRNFDGVDLWRGQRHVTYYHLLLQNHEIVVANNAYSESFFLGPEAMKILTRRHQAELEGMGILRNGKPVRAPLLARPALRRRHVDVLQSENPGAPLSRFTRSKTTKTRADALRRQLIGRSIRQDLPLAAGPGL